MTETRNIEAINQSVPSGKYPCELKRFFKRTSKSGNDQIAWVLEIQDIEFKGITLWKNSMLNSERAVEHLLKIEMPALGLFPQSIEEAVEMGSKFVGKTLLVEVRQAKNKAFPDIVIVGPIKRVGEKDYLIQLICSEL